MSRTGPEGAVWLLWYALQTGFSRSEAMLMTTGEARLFMAMYQVKREGAHFVDNREFDPETMDLEEILPGLF